MALIRRKAQIGDTIRITHLSGEDNRYDGKEGTVKYIDSKGQLHGTWGGLAVIPEKDKFEIISKTTSKSKTIHFDFDIIVDCPEESTKEEIFEKIREMILEDGLPEYINENNGYIID